MTNRISKHASASRALMGGMLAFPLFWNGLAAPVVTPVDAANKAVVATRLQGFGVTEVTVPAVQYTLGLVDGVDAHALAFTNGVYLTTGVVDSSLFASNNAVTEELEQGGRHNRNAVDEPAGAFRTALENLALLRGDLLGSLFDPAYFVLRVKPQHHTLNIRYSVLSEEYYRDNTLSTSDRFAIFVNGTNAATIRAASGLPVHAGLDTINMKTNQAFFIPNVVVVTNNGSANTQNWTYRVPVAPPDVPLLMTCNGATTQLVATIRVTPNVDTLITFVIADYGNYAYDTTLLLDEYGLTSGADIRVDVAASAAATNFTVTVSNPGPVDASEIVVTNFFPIGLTLTQTNHSANVRDWQTFGTTNVFVITSLPRGASEVIRLDCTAVSTGSYTNRAVAWPSEGDHAPANNAAEAAMDITLLGSPDLTLGKTVVSGLVSGQNYTVRGTNLTYAVAVTNRGDGATGPGWTLALTDTLPTGVALAGGSATNWAIPTLAAGEVWSTNLTVTVTAGAPTSLTNRCTLLYGASGSEETLVAECVTPVRPEADLRVTLTPSTNRVGWVSPPAEPGGERAFHYTVLVTNAGPDAATACTVVLGPVPPGLTLDDAALAVFDLPPGATRSFTIPAVAAPGLAGSVTNAAACASVVFDPHAANNSGEAVVLFEPVADVGVTVGWAGAAPVAGNQPVRLDVAVTNAGPAAAAGVVLRLAWPGQAPAEIPLGSFAAGGASNLTYWVTPTLGAATLSATGSVASAAVDPNGANDADDDTVALVWPDVAITLTDAPDPVGSEQTYAYMVGVTVDGAAVSNVSATVSLPAGASWLSGATNMGPISLAAGGSSNWVVMVRAPAVTAVTSLTAHAAVVATPGDTDPGNDTAQAVTTVNPPPKADIEAYVRWSATPQDGTLADDAYLFYASVTNRSADTVATNVSLSVWLASDPAELALPLPAGWQEEGLGTAVVAQVVAALPPGAGTGAWFRVRLTAVAASVTAHAQAASGNDDTPANNRAQQTLALRWPDLRVTIQPNPAQVTEGDTVDFTVTVWNDGNAPAANVWVTNAYPSHVAVTNAGGGEVSGQTDVCFNSLAIPAGGSTSLTVRVAALGIPPGVTSLVVMAHASIPPGDATPANNTAWREIPLYGRSVTGGMVWMLDHSTGTFFAGLTLTNSSAAALESVWFAFTDRQTAANALRSALWNHPQRQAVVERYADGTRYVDLTAAVRAALLAAGGDDVWDPGEVVRIGVSSATWAGGGTVVPLNERLLEMYDLNRQNPSLFVDLNRALGSRAGAFHHDSGIDADGDFRVSAQEVAAARAAWAAGTLSDEEYLFLSAANRGLGYKWDMERQQWVVIK